MTEADYDALSQKQLASLKRDTRISLEDAAVRATHKVMAELGDEDDDIQVYQRPWVGLTEAQFLEAVRLAENGNYLVAFVRIQEWLKEQNT
jgi:hypothetical protein